MPPRHKKQHASAAAATTAAAATPPAAVTAPSPHGSSASISGADFAKKIQPIYDALEANNLKSVAKLLSAAIVKYGRRPILLSLLALLQARQEQKQEALAAADEALASHPTEPHLLHTLSLVYKQLDMPQSVCALYSAALASLSASAPTVPPPEDLLLALFFSYVTVHAHEHAQATAMKLYTVHKQPHFLFYSATNQLLRFSQSLTSTSSSSSASLLRVSEKMIRRGYSLTPMTADDVELMFLLLCRLDDHRAALQWLSGKEGQAYGQDWAEERGRMLGRCYETLRWRRKARDWWEEMSRRYEADWEYLCRWMEGQLSRLDWSRKAAQAEDEKEEEHRSGSAEKKEREEKIEEEGDEDELDEPQRLQHLQAVIAELQADARNSGGRSRNPHLAAVHLQHLLLVRSRSLSPLTPLPSPAFSGLMSQVVSYYSRYASKDCVFHDLQPYLLALPPELRVASLQLMRHVCGADYVRGAAAADYDDGARIAKLASWHQCARFCNLEPAAGVEALSQLALTYYHHFLVSSSVASSSSASAPDTRGAGDAFLVLFSSVLLELHRLTSASAYLQTLSGVLEHALTFSPHSSEYRLLAMRLYGHPELSCPTRAAFLFSSLEIKQVMLISLSHLLLHDLMRSCSLQAAATLSQQIIAVHTGWEREEGDLLQLAYQQKRWGKVLEVEETGQRLRGRSFVLLWVKEEKRWLDLMRGSKELSALTATLDAHTQERKDEGEVREDLQVSSDYSVVACYDPPSSPLHCLLNRPAPPLLPAFRPLAAPAPINADGTYPVDSDYLSHLRFRRLLPALLSSAIHGDATALRLQLFALRALLSSLSLVQLPSMDSPSAAPSAAVLDGFQPTHWSICFLCLETCACVAECRPSTDSLLQAAAAGSSSPPTAAQLDDHRARWASIQRQLCVLVDLLSALSPALSASVLQLPMDEKQAVVSGVGEPRPFDPAVLSQSSLFLQFAALLLVVALQAMTASIPSRKSAAARKKKKGAGAGNEDGKDEEAVWEALVAARLSLAQLIRAFRAVLDGLSGLLAALSGAARVDLSPIFPLLQQCAELLEEARQRGRGAAAAAGGAHGQKGEVLDLDTVVSRVSAGLISGWVATGEEMSRLLLTYQQVLQHIKLP